MASADRLPGLRVGTLKVVTLSADRNLSEEKINAVVQEAKTRNLHLVCIQRHRLETDEDIATKEIHVNDGNWFFRYASGEKEATTGGIQNGIGVLFGPKFPGKDLNVRRKSARLLNVDFLLNGYKVRIICDNSPLVIDQRKHYEEVKKRRSNEFNTYLNAEVMESKRDVDLTIILGSLNSNEIERFCTDNVLQRVTELDEMTKSPPIFHVLYENKDFVNVTDRQIVDLPDQKLFLCEIQFQKEKNRERDDVVDEI